jgi:hypothetical protein|tara:strand:- start:1141 stop:2070 length:930 start_codon:yes stop_codon:yes gene_type:complete
MSFFYTKTLDPVLYDLNVFYEKDFYSLYTNYEDYLVYGLDLLSPYLEYNKSNVIFDPIESKSLIYEELDQTPSLMLPGPGLKQDISFQAYWYEKFLTSMSEVQFRFDEKLGDKIKFFTEISDSIGLLRNVNFMEDDSVLPIWDIDFNVSSDSFEDKLIPESVASSVVNKLSPDMQIMIKQMSLYNTNVYRHNMFAINDDISSSEEAHGSNLVADYFHYDRMYKLAKEELEADLALYFNEVYQLILWYENYNPQNTINQNFQQVKKDLYYINQNASGSLEGNFPVSLLKTHIKVYNNTASFINRLGVVAE